MGYQIERPPSRNVEILSYSRSKMTHSGTFKLSFDGAWLGSVALPPPLIATGLDKIFAKSYEYLHTVYFYKHTMLPDTSMTTTTLLSLLCTTLKFTSVFKLLSSTAPLAPRNNVIQNITPPIAGKIFPVHNKLLFAISKNAVISIFAGVKCRIFPYILIP